MKVWAGIGGTAVTGFTDIEIGQEVTVFKCGSGRSVFGERAHLARTTSQHLVFVTDSGAEVKTAIDNLFDVRGKAAKEGVAVSLRLFDQFEGIIHWPVSYWNRKKLCLEKK